MLSRMIATSLVFLSLFGCAMRKDSTLNTNPVPPVLAPKKINILIVLSQGFHSCTNAYEGLLAPVRKRQEEVRKELEQKYGDTVEFNVAYMDVCFTGGVLEDFKSEKIFHQVTHADGTKKRRLEAGPSTIHHIIETVAAEMGTPENPTHVYLIGHSHGGWLMLNTAKLWRGEADLRRLFTIDAISYQRCTQTYLIFNRLMKGLSIAQLTKDPECTRFPSDIAPYAPLIRKKISGLWTNFYQTKFWVVHSLGSPSADSNREMMYDGPEDRDFAHKAILGDARVWNAITLQIVNDLQDFAAAQP